MRITRDFHYHMDTSLGEKVFCVFRSTRGDQIYEQAIFT